MTPANLLAEAAEADRAANSILAKIDVAREAMPDDYFGERPLTPPGMAAASKRASDLRFHARCLRVEAAEIAVDSAPLLAAKALAATRPASAIKPVATAIPDSVAEEGASVFHASSAAETEAAAIESAAARILASDSASAVHGEALKPHDMGLGAAGAVGSVAARILASDGEPDSIPADKDVPRDNKRVKMSDGPVDVEDVVRRVLEA